jgi:hypothetical protein
VCRRIPQCCRNTTAAVKTDPDGSARASAAAAGTDLLTRLRAWSRPGVGSGISLVAVSRRLFRRLGLLVLLAAAAQVVLRALRSSAPSDRAPTSATRGGDGPAVRAAPPARSAPPPAPASPDKVVAEEASGPAEAEAPEGTASAGTAAAKKAAPAAPAKKSPAKTTAKSTPKKAATPAKKAPAKKAPAKKSVAQKAAKKAPAKKAEPPKSDSDS